MIFYDIFMIFMSVSYGGHRLLSFNFDDYFDECVVRRTEQKFVSIYFDDDFMSMCYGGLNSNHYHLDDF